LAADLEGPVISMKQYIILFRNAAFQSAFRLLKIVTKLLKIGNDLLIPVYKI
jgi:hypothetical protein